MTIQIATVLCGDPSPQWPAKSLPESVSFTWIDNTDNQRTPCQCYQELLDTCTADVLIYLHADVTIHDPEWVARIIRLFENENCVAAGFGGATGLGHPNLYKKRFQISNLARVGYASNQDDWQVHGTYFTGDRRVSVLDQFCMAIRVEWLRDHGGWPVSYCNHHMLDAFIACEAARDNREVWQCGVSCLHSGGGTSTSSLYRYASWLHDGSLEGDHITPHLWIWNTYRDVLPLEI